jgi:methionyl aminopeptidase
MMKLFDGAVKSQRRRKIGTDSPVLKGVVSPRASIPSSVLSQSAFPEYALNGVPHNCTAKDKPIYEPNEYPSLRAAGHLARKMLDYANSLVKPGVSTDYIDSLVYDEILKHGAYPSPLNYSSFPKSICTSPNEVVCHGIPDSRVLEDGDIISIDVSLYLNGYHGDNCGKLTILHWILFTWTYMYVTV